MPQSRDGQGRGRRVSAAYLTAKEAVVRRGFAAEIDWQERLRFSEIRETDFLREGAWVVLSSGMRESVVRSKFPAISEAFFCWESADRIVRARARCKAAALAVFCHGPKVDAVVGIAQRVCADGFEAIKQRIESDGLCFLRTFPFMGPATSRHLAKNLGLDVVKPDRHLLRVAAAAEYADPDSMCADISAAVGDRVSVVDLVIWRFATLNPDYPDFFA